VGAYRLVTHCLDNRLTDGGEDVSPTSNGNAVCFKKIFTMVLQMSLWGECYENVRRSTAYYTSNVK
jgi:hypothetical protein